MIKILIDSIFIAFLGLYLMFHFENVIENRILPLETEILQLKSNVFDLRSDLLDLEINEVICGEVDE